MALPGALIGAMPANASDEKIMELTAWVPLIALRPEVGRLVAGPDDPGGLGWIPRQVVATVAGAWLLRLVGRLARHLAG